MKHIPRIARCFSFPTFVLACHLIASRLLNLYAGFPHLDVPFHLLGGASLAIACSRALAYMQRERWIAVLDRLSLAAPPIALTSTAAIFWELMEFAFDHAFGTNMQVSLANSMQDQC
ncbi:MAG TPA: hypothetical protein VGJ22_14195, partial [Anaerolineales bacterium]